MDKVSNTTTLPNTERAMKDLEKYECTYQACAEKLKKIANEVENLKVQKQALKADIDEQKRIIKYYTDLHVEMASKIQRTLISDNKAKLVALSNAEKVKQTEAKIVEYKIPLYTHDVPIYRCSGLETSNEVLLLQKKELEQIVVDNNKHMAALLNKFKL